MRKSSVHNLGFTLIELLVVISIIALLTSIVLPELTRARQKAQNTTTIQQVQQFINAAELYAISNGNLVPAPSGASGCLGQTSSTLSRCLVDGFGSPVPNAQLNTQFGTYISTSNKINDVPVNIDIYVARGVAYSCPLANKSGTRCKSAYAEWYANGRTDCGFTSQTSYVDGSVYYDKDEVNSRFYDSEYNYSWCCRNIGGKNADGNTECTKDLPF